MNHHTQLIDFVVRMKNWITFGEKKSSWTTNVEEVSSFALSSLWHTLQCLMSLLAMVDEVDEVVGGAF